MKTYKRFALDYFFCDITQTGLAGITITSTVQGTLTTFLLYDRPNQEASVAAFINAFIKEARTRFCSFLVNKKTITQSEQIEPADWGIILPTEATDNIPDLTAKRAFERIFMSFLSRYGQIPTAFATFNAANKFDGNGQEIARHPTTTTSGTNTNTSEDLYTPRGETANARVNGRTTDNGSTSATGSVEDVTRTLGTDADKRTEAQTALLGVDILANILDAMESIFDYAGGEYVY